MSTESREELISAYLDGELSEDERAHVEKWLAESPPLAQLYDELRALRSGLESLERHKLDHDLAGAVLRRAEQAVLGSGSPKPVAGTIRPARQASATGSWWTRGAGWRRVVWPAVAVAAALLILVLDANRRDPKREIAQAPEQEAPASDLKADELELRAAPAAPERSAVEQAGDVELKARTFQPDLRAREDLDRKVMPKGAQAADEPASGSSRALPMQIRSLPGPAAQTALAGLVVPCTAEYLREGKFEKLLEEKKIKWRRLAPAESDDRKAEAGQAQPALRAAPLNDAPTDSRSLSATYVLEATREEVDEVLAELEFRPAGGAQDAYQGQRNLADEVRRRSASRSEQGGVTITLVAPAAPTTPPAEEP